MKKMNGHFVALSRWWTGLPTNRILQGRFVFSIFMAYFLTHGYKHTIAQLASPFLREGLTLVIIFFIVMKLTRYASVMMRDIFIIEKLSIEDPSGAYSRNFLKKAGEFVTYQALRSESWIVCIFLDLDRLKLINDTFGHHAGDAALKAVVERCKSLFRDTDFIVKYGGDEFVIIGHSSEPEKMCQKMATCGLIEMEFRDGDNAIRPLELDYSYGCSQVKVHAHSQGKMPSEEYAELIMETLIKSADAEMYKMKVNKRIER